MRRNAVGLACTALLIVALAACAPQNEAAGPAAPANESPTAASTPGGASSETTMDIGGIVWLVSEIAREKVVTPADARQPFIRFDTEKKFANGFLGCNTFRGGYESEGKTLKFGALASTKMACQGDRDKVEFAMNQALVKVAGFDIQGNQLTLTGADGTVLIRCHARDGQ